MLIILGGGFFAYQTIISSRKFSKITSLESLAVKFESWTKSSSLAKSSSEKTFNKWLDEGFELAGSYKKSVKVHLKLAQKLNLEYPEKFQEFWEKDKILRKIADYRTSYYAFNLDKTKEGEKILKTFNEAVILLNKVKIIQKDGEIIKAKYQEKENIKIPIGYSFIVNEPENGEKQKITVIVKGENKGVISIIKKEPVDGEKITGTGSQEDISKIVSVKLDEIIKLFQDQTLSAANILPFLDEENKEKAMHWESEYKSIVFNWRRFDKYEIVSGQIEFEKNSDQKVSQTPIKILLPVKGKYYQAKYGQENISKIPFYYNKEKDEWISTNKTIEEIFDIISNQIILATASPNSFTFPETKECDLNDRKVEIKSVGIYKKNALRWNFSKSLSKIIFNAGNQKLSGGDGGVMFPDSINYINSNKKTIFIGKTFFYKSTGFWSTYTCEASPNISFTFFSE